MANRYLKGYSMPLIIREMQKIPTSSHQLGWLFLKSKKISVARCGEKWTLVHCWCECKLTQLLWKLVCQSLKKLKLELPHHPVISCWGIYSKGWKSGSQKNIYNPTFTAVWFTTKIYNQPTCSLKDEWIQKFTAHITSSLKKERNPAFCNIIDEPGGRYMKWTRHRKKKLHDLT